MTTDFHLRINASTLEEEAVAADISNSVLSILNERLNVSYARLLTHSNLINRGMFEICLIGTYALIFLVGLLSNFTVIYFVLVNKRMHTMTNKFIMNLSLADLLVIFVCIPVTACRYLSHDWLLGELMCRISNFIQGVSLSVSVLTLTAISVDRYFIIYKPMKARTMCTSSKIKLVLIIIWLLSMFIMSPLLFVFNYEQINVELLSISMIMCIERWPSYELKIVYELVLLCVLFLLPTIFMAYAYKRIANALWFDKSKKQVEDNENADDDNEGTLVSTSKRETTLAQRVVVGAESNNGKNQTIRTAELAESNQAKKATQYSLLDVSPHKCDCRCQSKSARKTDRDSINNNSEKLRINKKSAATSSLIYQLKIYNSQKRKMLNRNELAICKLIESRRRVVKLCVILIFLFLISWTPYHLVSVCIDLSIYYQQKLGAEYRHDDESSNDEYIVGNSNRVSSLISAYIYPITLCLALGNSASNPVCYMILSRGFWTMCKAQLYKLFNLVRKKK